MVQSKAALIDMEFAQIESQPEFRKQLGLRENDPLASRVILSAHFGDRKPDDIHELAKRMLAARGPVAKIAYVGATAADGFAAADLMHRHGPRVIAICMGEEAAWSRIVAKKLGAFGTFASVSRGNETAPGQLTVGEMLRTYRWREAGRKTRVYGVVGDPVSHSLGPVLFNHWFAGTKTDAVYMPFCVRREEGGMRRFLEGCLARPWLDAGGFSITLPHKEAALRWLGDSANSMSKTIGAVNTICFRDGKPFGYNTDCYAAVDSLAGALGVSRVELAGMTVDVLGAGGAARAMVNGLTEVGCRVTLFARRLEQARTAAREFDCEAKDWGDRQHRTGEILINCTPIGMWPKVAESPMPAASLRGCRLAFDMIYRPSRTQLLADAEAAGCQALNGLDMFLRQAAMQFELWTGRRPDCVEARKLLEAELQSEPRP